MLKRNSDAWRHFVSQFAPLIRRRVVATAKECRFVLVDQEIEDVCSDVMKALVAKDMASLRNFQGRSQLSTWLSVIARRTCLAFLNRRPADRGEGRYDDSSGNLNLATHETPAVEQMIRVEQFDQLDHLVSQLRSGDQRILQLYFQDGMSYQQISDSLSISINAVGPKLHRAQSRLKNLARCRHE